MTTTYPIGGYEGPLYARIVSLDDVDAFLLVRVSSPPLW